MAQLVTAQIAEKLNKEIETTWRDKIAVIHKIAIKKAKTRNSNTNYDVSGLSKTGTTDHKTLDSLVFQEWNDNLNVWEPVIREQFTYDSNDRVDESIFSLWDSNTSSWKEQLKEEYTFDTNGNLILQLRYFQYTSNVWDLVNKTEWTYDSYGNIILEEYFLWDILNNLWVRTYKYELTYDSNQNLVLEIGYQWFSGINQWQNSYKDDYFYTDSVLTSEINSNWNYGTSQWDFTSQWLYNYTLNQLTTEIQQLWDSNLSSWKNESKFDYTYDANDNISESTNYNWEDGTPGSWVLDSKDEFVYDFNFTFAELTLPYFYGNDFDEAILSINNMLIGYIYYDYNNGLWVPADRILLFYSDYTNALDVSTFEFDPSIRVYPNPTSEFLAIDTDTPIDRVEIYSILGEKVKDVQTNFKTIPFYDLSEGVYIVKIATGNQSILKRIIKR